MDGIMDKPKISLVTCVEEFFRECALLSLVPYLSVFYKVAGYSAFENGLLCSIRAIVSSWLTAPVARLATGDCGRWYRQFVAAAALGNAFTMGFLVHTLHGDVLSRRHLPSSGVRQLCFVNSTHADTNTPGHSSAVTVPSAFEGVFAWNALNAMLIVLALGAKPQLSRINAAFLLYSTGLALALLLTAVLPLDGVLLLWSETFCAGARVLYLCYGIFIVASLTFTILVIVRPSPDQRTEETGCAATISGPRLLLYHVMLALVGLSEGVSQAFVFWKVLQLRGSFISCVGVQLSTSVAAIVSRPLLAARLSLHFPHDALLLFCLPNYACWFYVMHLNEPIWLLMLAQVLMGFSQACADESVSWWAAARMSSPFQSNAGVSSTDIARSGFGRGVLTLFYAILLQHHAHGRVYFVSAIFYLSTVVISLIVVCSLLIVDMILGQRRRHSEESEVRPIKDVDDLIATLDAVETMGLSNNSNNLL